MTTPEDPSPPQNITIVNHNVQKRGGCGGCLIAAILIFLLLAIGIGAVAGGVSGGGGCASTGGTGQC